MRRVAEGVWCIEGSYVNSYILQTALNRCVLVDCGLPGSHGRIRAGIRELRDGGCTPTAIILTHGHRDHVGAARELSEEYDVPIYAHFLELPYLDGRSQYPPADPTVGGFDGFVSRFLTVQPRRIGAHLQMLPGSDLEVEGAIPEHLPEWRWVSTPGHSPGHISLFRQRDRTLLAGDALATTCMDSWTHGVLKPRRLWRGGTPLTCDWVAARHSVRLLARLQPHAICCGHGRPILDAHAASELGCLAEAFPLPPRGRYLRCAADTNEFGVANLPDKPFDYLPLALIGSAVAVMTGCLTWSKRSP